ncbi:MAG: lysine--tRNA ligase [Candidatus Ranarchaeia archaeon]
MMIDKEFWLKPYIDEILDRKVQKITLNTGKTTSGPIHIGILRELLICDALKRILEEESKDIELSIFLDDFDSAKHFPPNIPESFSQYLGKPFCDIPDPEGEYESYAKRYGNEFIESLTEFGLDPIVRWTSDVYKTAKMKEAIRTSLKNIDILREIYKKYITPTLNENQKESYLRSLETWNPVMIVCESCGKLMHPGKALKDGENIPNRIMDFDLKEDTVTYKCNSCQNKDTVSIEKSRLKLTWRVDWPAKWSVYNVICEPAGKDHATKGGAYDTGLEICNRVFGYQGPVKIPYEWLRFGTQDMKTHKGITFTPKEYLRIGHPETLRYQILKTPGNKAINIKPEFIPKTIDESLEIEEFYYNQEEGNPKTSEAKNLYPLIVVKDIKKNKPKRLPFRFAIIFAQLESIMSEEQVNEKSLSVFNEINGLDKENTEYLDNVKKELSLAKTWVELYAPERMKIIIPEEIPEMTIMELSSNFKTALKEIISILSSGKKISEEKLQNKIFKIAEKNEQLTTKELFQGIYKIILNKKYGPRLGAFILSLDREWVIERMKQIL